MSQRSRRFVGRLDRGQELCATLRSFCKEHDIRSGEIRASGLLASVEIAPYDREARGYAAPRRLRAFFELVSLHGTVAMRDGEVVIHAHAVLARDNQDRGGGIDILGGLLAAAEVLSCEFILEAFDDVTLVREFDPALGVYGLARADARSFVREEPVGRPPPTLATGSAAATAAATPPATTAPRSPTQARASAPATSTRSTPAAAPPRREPEVLRARPAKPLAIPEGKHPLPRAEVAAPPTSASEPAEPTWEDAVRRSAQLPDEPENALHQGDILEHPSFGRCEIQRIDEGAERVSVRLTNGRLVELGLEVLHLERLRTDGQRQYFRVHPGKRRGS